MVEIINGELSLDILSLQSFSERDLARLPHALQDQLRSHIQEQAVLGWGSRVFRNGKGEVIVTPDIGGWYDDPELRDLQVNVYDPKDWK